jgi:alanine racemase
LPEQLELLLGEAGDAPLSIYLKLNTGMNRLGFTGGDLPAALAILRSRPATATTLMTHFADADGERGVAWQLERFKAMAGDWTARSAWPIRRPSCATRRRTPTGCGRASCSTAPARSPSSADRSACSR